MKKSTLIVLLLAAALGCAVYFKDIRHGGSPEKSSDEGSPAFSFQASDLTSLTIDRKDGTTSLESHGGGWDIVKPVAARADQPSVAGIADGLAAARISRTLSPGAEMLATYGLKPPAVTLSFTLKSGAKHTVQLGAKDFSGADVYGVLDNSKDVVLLPASLLTSSDKSFDELRDRAVMDLAAGDVISFDLKNSSGRITATKTGSDWTLAGPRATGGDPSAISVLLGAIASARWDSVASEVPDGGSRYGLDHPQITFTVVQNGGKSSSLLIGKKEGDLYYALDTARPVTFRVKGDLMQRLSAKLFDLRDRNLIRLDATGLARAEVHRGNDVIACAKDSSGQWKMEEPADHKGKSLLIYKLTAPLESAVATEILDTPSADVAARLAKPAVRIVLTFASGKKTEVDLSSASGDFIYARTGESPAVLKINKQTLTDLNLKADDLAE